MASFGEILAYGWEGMTLKQKIVAAVIPVVLAAFILTGWIRSGQLYFETRRLEREANAAKRDAADALKKAADIAKEKLEVERKLAAIEEKRNVKEQEAKDATLRTLDARSDYVRTLRERRTDNPSTEQLCSELRALGYPCS